MKPSKIDTRAKDYIGQLLVSPEFKKTVLNIRKWNQIPDKGFDILMFDELVLADKHPRIPDEVKNKDSFTKAINNFLLRYGFSQEWFEFFSDYMLFEFVGDTEEKKQIFLLDLGNRKPEKRKLQMAILEKNTPQNPIALLLPPFASQRDIYDFIAINWDEIEKIQQRYNKKLIRIVSSRRKNQRVEKRNNFIYKNRHLSKKELMSKVSDEFGDILDYTYLSKIIASEGKKRSAGI